MTVTAIENFKSSRVKIYVDEQFAFVLYRGELSKFSIAEGEELSAENYRLITEELLPKRAGIRALRLLASGRYTEKQLRDKLTEGGYPEKVVCRTLSYVSSFGYVDDESYACDYMTLHYGRSSKRMIEAKLRKKGISTDVIEAAFLKLESGKEAGEEENFGEETAVRRLLEKKHFDAKSTPLPEQRKIFASICRRGFSPELVRQVMNI